MVLCPMETARLSKENRALCLCVSCCLLVASDRLASPDGSVGPYHPGGAVRRDGDRHALAADLFPAIARRIPPAHFAIASHTPGAAVVPEDDIDDVGAGHPCPIGRPRVEGQDPTVIEVPSGATSMAFPV